MKNLSSFFVFGAILIKTVFEDYHEVKLWQR